MDKIKQYIKSIEKKHNFIYKLLKKTYTLLSKMKYNFFHFSEKIKMNRYFEKEISQAIKIIEEYREKEYIVFYNPTWLGVANSTKGLFKYIVPLEQVYKKRDAKRIAKVILENNIKTVIFSQIVDGWTSIIEKIKETNNDICVKVIWHGNCYEYFSDYTWNLNKEVMRLYNNNKIQAFGFVRTIMKEFYERAGYKSYYLQNNVHLDNIARIQKKDKLIRIGVYNADSRELKNIYTTLAAIKNVGVATADVVPINSGATEFCKIIDLNITKEKEYIPNEDLLLRIQNNSINVYSTFTENSPMFPIESFEIGVPCLIGNNNDFFIGTELEDYVVLKREDDIEYLKNKIIYCMENREKIMELYKKWKIEFDKKCNCLVENFIKYE